MDYQYEARKAREVQEEILLELRLQAAYPTIKNQVANMLSILSADRVNVETIVSFARKTGVLSIVALAEQYQSAYAESLSLCHSITSGYSPDLQLKAEALQALHNRMQYLHKSVAGELKPYTNSVSSGNTAPANASNQSVNIDASAFKINADPQKPVVTEAVTKHVNLRLSNGSVYVGQMEGDLLHGRGKLTYADGSYYEGVFQNGELPIYGTIGAIDGRIYTGGITNGLADGKGTVIETDGRKYVGSFNKGLFDGQGTLTLLSGYSYIGEFKNNDANGLGTETLPDGSKRKGTFVNGAFDEAASRRSSELENIGYKWLAVGLLCFGGALALRFKWIDLTRYYISVDAANWILGGIFFATGVFLFVRAGKSDTSESTLALNPRHGKELENILSPSSLSVSSLKVTSDTQGSQNASMVTTRKYKKWTPPIKKGKQ